MKLLAISWVQCLRPAYDVADLWRGGDAQVHPVILLRFLPRDVECSARLAQVLQMDDLVPALQRDHGQFHCNLHLVRCNRVNSPVLFQVHTLAVFTVIGS